MAQRNVKFIRKNGRIIPIRSKIKSDDRKAKAGWIGGGALIGSGNVSTNLGNRASARGAKTAGKFLSRGGLAGGAVGLGLAGYGFVKSIQRDINNQKTGDRSFKTFAKHNLGDVAGYFGAATAGTYGAILGFSKLSKAKGLAAGLKNFRNARRASKAKPVNKWSSPKPKKRKKYGGQPVSYKITKPSLTKMLPGG